MKLKKWIALVPAAALALGLSTAALACGGHAHAHRWERTHICADADWDGWCDGCGAACVHQNWGHHGHHGWHC